MQPESLNSEEQERLAGTVGLFQALDKLVRGMRLYEGTGPLVERLLESVSEKATEVLEKGEITFSITPIGPTYLGEAVLEDGDPPKYLFQMYCDGVRELTFSPGLQSEEIIKMVKIFYADIKDPNEDIVTMMWRQSFSNIRYYAVDTLGVQVDDTSTALKAKVSENLVVSDQGEQLKMSSSDIRLLRADDQLLWMRESRVPVQAPESMTSFIEKLVQACHSEQDIRRFVAITIQCGDNDFSANDSSANDSMLINLIQGWRTNGDIVAILTVFRALFSFSQQNLELARNLLVSLMSPKEVVLYAPFFKNHSDEFCDLIKELLDFEDLPHENWVLLLKSLELGPSRQKLQSLLSGTGIDMTSLYLDALQSEDEAVVLDAIDVLGRIGNAPALEGLVGMLTSVLTTVRHSVLRSLQGRYADFMRVKLSKTLRDPDSTNRLLALSILTESTERQVGSAILGVMQGPDFQNYESEEQKQFFLALSKYPSPTVFQYLDQILAEKNITRSRKIIDRQLQAISCLKGISNGDSKSLLSKVSSRWYLSTEVKSEIKKLI